MSLPNGTISRAPALAWLLVALGIWLGCDGGDAGKRSEQRKGRKEPTCAVQDCTTGKVLDDGCDETGRCASCINACASDVPPSVAPVSR